MQYNLHILFDCIKYYSVGDFATEGNKDKVIHEFLQGTITIYLMY